MLAIHIKYLAGRCVATDHTNRDAPEWPPHPFRLFSALVAAMKATGETAGRRSSLEWLESQGPPAIMASSADRRDVATCFVPVNDATVPTGMTGNDAVKKAMELLPEYRKRQPRTFPSVTPQDPNVYMIWKESCPSEPDRRDLASLCSEVTYIGHSSSLVAVELSESAPDPDLIPDQDGEIVLRVPFKGQLTALETAYEHHQGFFQRTLPTAYERYSRRDSLKHEKTIPAPVFGDDWIVFRRASGPRLPIKSILGLTDIFRRAAINACDEPVPEALCGHDPAGAPSVRPHVAFTALPDVGHPYANGGILGLAAVLPRGLAGDERKRILQAFSRQNISSLMLGDTGVLELERQNMDISVKGLRPWAWCRSSRCWATVSPVVLDRFPKKDFEREGRSIIAEACIRIGLPEPKTIRLDAYSPIKGVPPAWAFPAHRTRRGKPRRWHTHAEITFDEPVQGPIILGAGRFQGYGLFRPRREK